MKKILYFYACYLLWLTGCYHDEAGPRTAWLYYPETQCADPWTRHSDDISTIRAISEHLRTQQIRVFSLEILNADTSQVYCRACGCPTGRRIRAEVLSEDVGKTESIGFRQNP